MKKIQSIITSIIALSMLTGCPTKGVSNSSNSSSINNSSSVSENSNNNPEVVGTEGLEYEKIPNKDEYMLVGEGTATDTNIVVASSYNGMPVTSIADRAFLKRMDENHITNFITSLIIPEGIKTIGDHAFSGCPLLESVQLPNSLTYVGDYAFFGCESLIGNVYNNLNYIGNENNPCMLLLSAEGASQATSIEIDPRCKFIRTMAFYNCIEVTQLIIPEGVLCIGSSAFVFCLNLTTVSMPESLIFIGEEIFRSCKQIQTTSLNGLNYIGNENNPYLILLSSTMSDAVTINVEPSCKLISNEVFKRHYSLTQINFGQNSKLTFIGNQAFFLCDELLSINLPANITYLGESSFASCEKLSTITFEGTVQDWLNIRKGDGWNAGVPATKVFCSTGMIEF